MTHHAHGAKVERHQLRPELHAGSPGRREDATPVGVAACDRGLHQGRGRDRNRDLTRVPLRERPANSHLNRPRCTLAIADDLARQRLGDPVQSRLEPPEPVANGHSPRLRLPVGEQQDCVVRAGVTVHGDAVERAIDSLNETALEQAGSQVRVRRDEGQHCRHVGVDHPGSLGDPADPDRTPVQLELHSR